MDDCVKRIENRDVVLSIHHHIHAIKMPDIDSLEKRAVICALIAEGGRVTYQETARRYFTIKYIASVLYIKPI